MRVKVSHIHVPLGMVWIVGVPSEPDILLNKKAATMMARLALIMSAALRAP